MKVKTRMRLLSVSLLLFAALFCVFSAPSARAEAQTSPQTEELYLERGGKKLYGKLYLPEDAVSPLPLVILSHGLGSNHHIMEPYADFFSDSGIAAFVFDYIGGSEESLSDGNMKDMSVLAEAADLSFLLDHFLADARFAEDGIFLFGEVRGDSFPPVLPVNGPRMRRGSSFSIPPSTCRISAGSLPRRVKSPIT